MKLLYEIKLYRNFKSIFLYLFFSSYFISSQITNYTTTLYIKTNTNIKEITHFDKNNNFKHRYGIQELIIKDSLFMVKIEGSFYGDKIKIELENEMGIRFEIGFLAKIEDIFYELSALETQESFNYTQETIFIEINETNSKEIKYLKSTYYPYETELTVIIPFNIYKNCYESCSKCSDFGTESNHNFFNVKILKVYYFKENDIKNICYTESQIYENYYLD